MATAKLGNFTIHFKNSEEYHNLKQEIFTKDTYYFETDNPAPLIIDAGAHIGLATLYFKKLYPAARVIAIEPHPENIKLLEQNIFENQLDDVMVVPAALDIQEGNTAFYADASGRHWFSTAGFTEGSWNKQQQSQSLMVPTLPLSNFLQEPVDFLKMDIEGAEQAVLNTARERLPQIKHLMIEFHPGQQSLVKLVELLEQQGFRVQLWKDGKEIPAKKARGLILIEALS